ncbi:MAG: hypothetical protein WBP61_09895 [Nocardioides sp.]
MSHDLTFVVIARDETAVAGPTMSSADRAVAAARDAGLGVECVLALVAPTPGTRSYFGQSRFDHWDRRELAETDLGGARHALLPDTQGRYVGLLEVGDLVSCNWLVAGARALDDAAGRQERAIAHPELGVVFDGRREVVLTVDHRSVLFSPHYLYFRDYYDAPCLAPRQALLELPHDVPRGPSAPDRELTVESMAAGWRHLVVADTIHFARCRDLSSDGPDVGPATVGRSLPALAIDRIRDLGPERVSRG